MGQLPATFQAIKELAELSSEGVFIYDLTNKQVSFSNALAQQWLGIREGGWPSALMPVYERIVPDDREYLKRQYLEALQKTATEQSEFRLRDDNGKLVIVCCTTYLLNSHIVVFVRDISQPKAHEDYLVEFGARKNTVLDILMHHLSGALNLMRNLSAEASKYIDDGADKNLKIFLDLLNNNNTHCLNVINDLLKVEHERSPRIVVKKNRIDVIAKIALVFDEFRQSYRHRIFEFVHNVNTFFINTDEIKLLQIVNNLISNAIKFSANEKVVMISVTENESDIIISVKDQGIGIPDTLVPFIFDRQSIASRSGLNGERSTGFGLSICKKLVELLQGKIWFETEVNEGSTFYFSLPKK